MTQTPSSPERSRGGQPGNANALKHGFYARRNPELRTDALEVLDTEFPGFEEEILILRVYIRRMLEQSGCYHRMEHGLAILRALSQAFSTLARLSREHRCLTANATPTVSVLRQERDDIAAVEDPVFAYDDFAERYYWRYGKNTPPGEVLSAYETALEQSFAVIEEIRRRDARARAASLTGEQAEPEVETELSRNRIR